MTTKHDRERGPKEGDCLLDCERVTGDKPRKIWIVRVPNDVAEAVDNAPGGIDLGTLTMEGKGKMCRRSITLRPYSEGLSLIDFDLKPVSGDTGERLGGKLYGFSVAKDKQSVRLEGTVSSQFAMRPVSGNRYEDFARKRNREAGEAKFGKKVQRLDDTDLEDGGDAGATGPLLFVPKAMYLEAEEAKSGSKALKDKVDGSSSSAMMHHDSKDADALREALFELFAEHDKVWIQDIKSRLGCGDAELRPLLRECCDKEKVGTRFYYKLNADYKA